jgi:hypothetical protein
LFYILSINFSIIVFFKIKTSLNNRPRKNLDI